MEKNIYFLGIGGIGMSALARYFLKEGYRVGGYDKTPTPLTAELEKEGAWIHYEDDVTAIPQEFLSREHTVVVYTPAIPASHSEFCHFKQEGFTIEKRSQMLGHISEGKYVMAVAGTHGKTSTTTLLTWLNHRTTGGGSAFLGGISKNFNSNLILGEGDRLVVEADEFDRSFLRLYPNIAIVTSADADHLDIYGTHEAVKQAFSQFIGQIKEGGSLILKHDVELEIINKGIKTYSYSYDTPCDFYAKGMTLSQGGHFIFDIVLPDSAITGCRLGIPGWVNIENCVAAVAAMWCAAKREGKELDHDATRAALDEFTGVRRRFDFYINDEKQVYMDDYAHHPRELSAAISSVKGMFPGRDITVLFQPHLYSRTNDLHAEFAEALSMADRVVLLPIYPARELPMEGVSSQMIQQRVSVPCQIVELENIVDHVAKLETDIVISFGAGDIDTKCESLAKLLSQRA